MECLYYGSSISFILLNLRKHKSMVNNKDTVRECKKSTCLKIKSIRLNNYNNNKKVDCLVHHSFSVEEVWRLEIKRFWEKNIQRKRHIRRPPRWSMNCWACSEGVEACKARSTILSKIPPCCWFIFLSLMKHHRDQN